MAARADEQTREARAAYSWQVHNSDSMLIADLRRGYPGGSLTPALVMQRLAAVADPDDSRNVWVTRLSRDQVMRYVQALQGRSVNELPLYGIPFVIKDHIDLEGVPTTAGCPRYAYTPQRSAHVVQKLLD